MRSPAPQTLALDNRRGGRSWRWLRRAIATLSITLVAASALGAQRRDSGSLVRTLRIANWDLGFQASQGGEGCAPLAAADYTALRAEVDELDADVVAFRGMPSAAFASRLFERSRYVVIMERSRPVPLAPCRDIRSARPGRQQTIGVAVRRNIPFSLRDITALQLGDPLLHSGLAIALRPRAGRPLRLLNVQLQTGCSTDLTSEACATLLRQTDILEQWIASAVRGPTRFIVVGGWGGDLERPGDPVWAELNDAEQPNGGLVIARSLRRCGRVPGNAPDSIVLDRRAAAQQVQAPDAAASEHSGTSRPCPVVVEFVR